ncbi:MAG TPA: hypothetical protein VER33_16835 [Polyangiaceae bacterium]|nr:hypothetical protein [Polyangiaceae bacterium]
MVSRAIGPTQRAHAGRWLRFVALLTTLFASTALQAQRATPEVSTRPALFEWDAEQRLMYLSIAFRDVIDSRIQEKLRRGLPTTIVLTATIFASGSPEPLSTTAQTCKVTWHVWEEAYRVELTRPGQNQVRWTTTVEGVLRRCAEARRLLAGDSSQVAPSSRLYANGKIQVNPISPEVLQKIRRWVMRPSSTGTAAPGDALFSTFTGLFLQRVGEAEREVKFITPAEAVTWMPARSADR